MLSAPNQPPIADQVQQNVAAIQEQAQKNIAAVQEQAQAAVKDLNERVLKASGAQSNTQLLETVQMQAQQYATQVQGDWNKGLMKVWEVWKQL